MNILVLGASGMLGSTMFKVLRENKNLSVWGTLRSTKSRMLFSSLENTFLIDEIDATQSDLLLKAFTLAKPAIVVNCIGLTMHRQEFVDPLQILELNSILPLRLAHLCKAATARMIHVSTDCVFLGTRGGYVETDASDANDFYGKSKYLGEIATEPHVITLRTSIIGHELNTRHGLLEWFLSQKKECKGFSRAVFSGLPTIVFAKVVRDIVIPRPELSGLYHVAARPINKLALLELIARVYRLDIKIIPDDSVVIDRSLDGTRFSDATGYVAPGWEEMINLMHADAQKRNIHNVQQ